MSLTKDQADKLSSLLSKLEARTELEACAVVTKEGMRIACAVASEMDADVYSAASAALVNLGETTLSQLRHGGLKEIIVRGDDGYTILTQAGRSYMVVGSCKKLSRMGYYLALLHRFSNKVATILGETVAAPAVPEPVPTFEPTPAIQPTMTEEVIPEPVEISDATISFGPQEPAAAAASIPEPVSEEVGFDKSALFEALQSLGTEPEAKQAAPESDVEVDTGALIDALKPKAAEPEPTPASGAPFTSGAKPAAKAHHDDDELFKISDKEAVLEALKVLGWEEPNE